MTEETQCPPKVTDAEIFDSTFAAVTYIYRAWNMSKKERRAYERVMRHLAEVHPEAVRETATAEAIAKFRQLFSHPAWFVPVGNGEGEPEDAE